jgi:hypothetical protein
MARSNNNATSGLRGRVDQFVFKERCGTTFVSKVPDMSRVVASEKQRKCRADFRLAARYAKAKLREAGMKDYYRSKAKPNQTAYNVAFKEYFQLNKGQ